MFRSLKSLVLVNIFLDNKHVSRLSDAYYLLSSLNFLSNNNINVPLYLTVVSPSSSSSSPTQVRVTNIIDKFATKAKVVLRRASRSDDSSVIENMELIPSTSNNVLYEFPKEKGNWATTPGFYTLKLSVDPITQDERFKAPDRITVRVRVAAEAKLDKFEIFVSDSAKGSGVQESDIQRATYPSQMSSSVTGSIGKFIHMKLTLSCPLNPAQIFAKLTSPKGKSGYAIFSNQDNSNTYTSKMDLGSAEVADELDGNGKYNVEILVGDSLLVRSLTWSVATLDLTLPALPSSHQRVDPFALKPEIQHAFRVDEARPARVIALLFTVIVLLPLAFLIIKLLSSWTMSLPSSVDYLQFVLFHGSLLAILLLYFWYWVKLNIFQAIIFLIPLSFSALVSGRYLLRSLHMIKTKTKSE